MAKLPDGWKLIQVQDFADVIRGASPRPKGDPRYYGGKIPRLMGADVTRDGKYVTPKLDFLTEEGARLSRPMSAGALTIVCSGLVGVPAILAVDACIHDGFLALENISKSCDIEFLYYMFWHIRQTLESAATHGGVFINLTTSILKEFEVPVPPLPEQRKIAAILSTWDEAITLTERLIAALRQRKQALMQMLLTGEVRFPGFEGEWEETQIGEVATVRRGASPRPIHDPKWFADTGRAWIRIADVTASRTRFLNEASQYLSALGEQFSTKVEIGDLIMSIAATIGVPKIVNIPACIHDGFVAFSGYENKFNREFLYHFLNFKTSELANGGQPGTQRNINSELVRQIKIPLIGIDEQGKIANVLNQTDEATAILGDYLNKVRIEKCGLMQQLLTGAIRV